MPPTKTQKLKITAIVPCRRNSQRVKNKNTRPFASFPGGLLELKLRQLLKCKRLDSVVVNTDDDKAAEIASRSAKLTRHVRLHVVERPSCVGLGTDELIAHIVESTETDIILWTHTTSPLIAEGTYDEAIRRYLSFDHRQYDSLMSVTRLQEFVWDREGPKNHDRAYLKWPRTQDLPRWYSVNSGIFICGRHLMAKCKDRIGDRVYLMELDRIQGLDIDWPADFALAEMAFKLFGPR